MKLLPRVPTGNKIDEQYDLWESTNMLAKRAAEWRAAEQRKARDLGIAEGKEEGLAEGLAEGKVKGAEHARRELALLCRTTLEERFGALDRFSVRRIEEASFEQLSQWLLQLLKVDSVQELLGSE